MPIIVLTNGMETTVSREDFNRVSSKTWHYDHGYAVHTTRRNGKPYKIYLHDLILPPPSGYEVDHKDTNKLNNRRSNLRLATKSQNKMNTGPRSNNRSGYRGVSWDDHTGKWRARVRVGDKDISLGRFPSRSAAKKAYEKAARELHGEFYRREKC